MVFYIISASILFLIAIIFTVYRKKNKRPNVSEIQINFEDIDSLNVSKIVKDENDTDFIRNEFWFQFKQKGKINEMSLVKLKQIFEKTNNIKIADYKSNINESTINQLDTLKIIEIIISDDSKKEDVITAFLILENKIK